MNATFRLRRKYRNLGLSGVLGFLTLAILGITFSLTEADIRARFAAVAFMGCVPLSMMSLSGWMLVAYWREELTISGMRVFSRGILRSSEIGLLDVVQARWRVTPASGSVVLQDERSRISIVFDNYEAEESEEIIRYLRTLLRSDVQTGWNLFVYKTRFGQSQAARLTPGSDEILLRRERLDRYFIPCIVLATLGGMAGWWLTGEFRFLSFPLFPLVMWATSRSLTPSTGTVEKKLSFALDRDSTLWLGFLLIWLLVSIAGLTALGIWRARLTHPNAVMLVTSGVWFAILLNEAARQDRRQDRREQDAADHAAKKRGEAANDDWDCV